MNDRQQEESKFTVSTTSLVDTKLVFTVKEQETWVEIRMQGRLPERRANHCSFIWSNNGNEQ